MSSRSFLFCQAIQRASSVQPRLLLSNMGPSELLVYSVEDVWYVYVIEPKWCANQFLNNVIHDGVFFGCRTALCPFGHTRLVVGVTPWSSLSHPPSLPCHAWSNPTPPKGSFLISVALDSALSRPSCKITCPSSTRFRHYRRLSSRIASRCFLPILSVFWSRATRAPAHPFLGFTRERLITRGVIYE